MRPYTLPKEAAPHTLASIPADVINDIITATLALADVIIYSSADVTPPRQLTSSLTRPLTLTKD